MAWESNDNTRLSLGEPRVLLALMLVVALVLSVLYSRETDTGFLHRMQRSFSSIYTPVTSAGVGVGEAVNDARQEGENSRASDETLAELEARVAELEAQVALDEEYVQECQRLQNMLNLVNMYGIDGVAARVVGRDSEPYSQVITAAAGSAHGIALGDTVIGQAGVVGQVIAVRNDTCDIRLLTDQNSGVAVMIQYNRKEGLVKGSLEGLLYLEDVDSTVLVQVGDVLVTSGLGGSYVRGLIVGQVVKVTESVGDSSRLIIVSPVDDPATTTEVFIVKSMTSWGAAA